jgi:phosphohistidine phosphatase
MKTLYLLRHAKSSRADRELTDQDRPLNSRGLNDITKISARLREKSAVQAIISSTAVRAFSTAKLMAEGIGIPAESVSLKSEMYLSGPLKLLEIVRQLDAMLTGVMLVGHNPTITEFVNSMSGANISNVPTCGLVTLKLNSDTWAKAAFDDATFVEFDYPKKEV